MVGVFGLRGELKVAPTRIGAGALAAGMALRARFADGTVRDVRVRALRYHKDRPLLTFDGVADASAAQALVGATLALPRADVTLGAGEFFDEDLIGCTLVDADGGASLGTVVAVEHFPAQDVLLVGPHRAMVPLVRAFVRRVEVAARRIVVSLPPGLLDDTEAEEA